MIRGRGAITDDTLPCRSPKPSSSISVDSTTPPPPSSIADRMAALRVAGMKTGSVPPSSSKAIPSPTKLSHLPPIPPKKPEALVGRTLGLSPPGSPQSRPLRLDSKTRDRSGSAPPIIPCSPTSAQFPRAGSSSPPRSPQSPPVQLSPSTSHHPYRSASPQRNYTPSAPPVQVDDQYSTLNSLSTPSLATYPSLSELEATFDNQPRTAVSESSHSLASAPLSDPRTGRSPLPPAPLPFEPLSLENQPMLSPNLTPASSRPPSIASSASTSNSTPVPSSTNPSFSIPFTNEVLPAALYAYLDMALGVTGKGPRVLLLDVRTRDEFDRGRIIGETLCLEPLTLRSG
jgi:ubiquitin carboxyl-terminal hydrolase 8